jgi:hypothetical protein
MRRREYAREETTSGGDVSDFVRWTSSALHWLGLDLFRTPLQFPSTDHQLLFSTGIAENLTHEVIEKSVGRHGNVCFGTMFRNRV